MLSYVDREVSFIDFSSHFVVFFFFYAEEALLNGGHLMRHEAVEVPELICWKPRWLFLGQHVYSAHSQYRHQRDPYSCYKDQKGDQKMTPAWPLLPDSSSLRQVKITVKSINVCYT